MRLVIQVLTAVLSSTAFAGGTFTGSIGAAGSTPGGGANAAASTPGGSASAVASTPGGSVGIAENAPSASARERKTEGAQVEYGVDLRLRSVHLPQSVIQWFLASGTGGNNIGVGIDVVRRRGNFELQLGIEFEHINPSPGVYILDGMSVPRETVDYLVAHDDAPENFGWITFEFSFLHHTPLTKYLALRYGAGLGIGVLTGGLYRWDVQCEASATVAAPVPGCVPGDRIPSGTGRTASDADGSPQTSPAKYDLPPVFPVVNAIAGLQVRPTAKAVVNIEFGLRTLPFFGMSAGYFF